MIEGAKGIREAYRHDDVVRTYVQHRFWEPIGALLHSRQVASVRAAIRREKPRLVLEIAPGPARITCDIAPRFKGVGVLVDASGPMLVEAKRRLNGHSGWHFVQGDAFTLPFRGVFDMAYSFRLIRHFNAADRQALYRELRELLRPGGLLLFDAVNAEVSGPLRATAHPEAFRHYDALLGATELRTELEAAGFTLVVLDHVQRHYSILNWLQVYIAPRWRGLARGLMEAADRLPGAPLEWVVVCRRK